MSRTKTHNGIVQHVLTPRTASVAWPERWAVCCPRHNEINISRRSPRSLLLGAVTQDVTVSMNYLPQGAILEIAGTSTAKPLPYGGSSVPGYYHRDLINGCPQHRVQVLEKRCPVTTTPLGQLLWDLLVAHHRLPSIGFALRCLGDTPLETHTRPNKRIPTDSVKPRAF